MSPSKYNHTFNINLRRKIIRDLENYQQLFADDVSTPKREGTEKDLESLLQELLTSSLRFVRQGTSKEISKDEMAEFKERIGTANAILQILNNAPIYHACLNLMEMVLFVDLRHPLRDEEEAPMPSSEEEKIIERHLANLTQHVKKRQELADKLILQAAQLRADTLLLSAFQETPDDSNVQSRLGHPLSGQPFFIMGTHDLELSLRDCIVIWRTEGLRNKAPVPKLTKEEFDIYSNILDRFEIKPRDIQSLLVEYANLVFINLNKEWSDLQTLIQSVLLPRPEECSPQIWVKLLPILYIPPASPHEKYIALQRRLKDKSSEQEVEEEILRWMADEVSQLDCLLPADTDPERLNRALNHLTADSFYNTVIMTEFEEDINNATAAIESTLPIKTESPPGRSGMKGMALTNIEAFKSKRAALISKGIPLDGIGKRSSALNDIAHELGQLVFMQLEDDIPFPSVALPILRSLLMDAWTHIAPGRADNLGGESQKRARANIHTYVTKLSEGNLPPEREQYQKMSAWAYLWSLVERLKENEQDSLMPLTDIKDALQAVFSRTYIRECYAELIRQCGLSSLFKKIQKLLPMLKRDYEKDEDIKKSIQEIERIMGRLSAKLEEVIHSTDGGFLPPTKELCAQLMTILFQLTKKINFREQMVDEIRALADLLPAIFPNDVHYRELAMMHCKTLPEMIFAIHDDNVVGTTVASKLTVLSDTVMQYSAKLAASEQGMAIQKQVEETTEALLRFKQLLASPDTQQGLREKPDETLQTLRTSAALVDAQTQVKGKSKCPALVPVIDNVRKKLGEKRRIAASKPNLAPAKARNSVLFF